MKPKALLIVILFFYSGLFELRAAEPPSDKARGMFFALGLGPRLPVFGFSNSNALGYGVNLEFDYTDTEYLPIMLYGNVGVNRFPGTTEYYQTTDYANYTVTMVPVSFGGRIYFKPILENILLLMPHFEAGIDFIIYENLNQFKAGSGLPNFVEDGSKFGLHIGGGFSMFLMEMSANYHMNKGTSYGSLDFKVRLPLFVSI